MTVQKIKQKADHERPYEHQRNVQAIKWKINNQDVDIKMFTTLLYKTDNYTRKVSAIFSSS